MLRNIEIPNKSYEGFDVCIFCLKSFDEVEVIKSDEHVIPYALTGVGEIILKNGSCKKCNSEMNESFEQAALKADLFVPRVLLDLKRRKKKTPHELPKVSIGNVTLEEALFTIQLNRANYPKIFKLIMPEPAGKLLGIHKEDTLSNFKMMLINMSSKHPTGITTAHPFNHTKFFLTIAKIAYCFGVAELGLDGFNGDEIRDLLKGSRSDVYNFAGGISVDESFHDNHFHRLAIRDRGNRKTVIVQLFASYNAPMYEVVIGDS